MNLFYDLVYPYISRYVTSGSVQGFRLISNTKGWKKQVIHSIILQISNIIDSEEEFYRLLEVGERNGLLTTIEKGINDKRWWVVAETTVIIGKLNLVQYEETIHKNLYAKEFDVWSTSAKTLCSLGNSEDVIDFLIKNADELKPSVVNHIGDMIGRVKIAEQRDIKRILTEINNVSSHLQGVFLDVLGKRGVVKAIPIITEYLSSENRELRLKALRAIGDIGLAINEKQIISMLESGQWNERVLTIYVIQQCKMKQSMPVLVGKCLGDSNWWVRVRSAQTLYSFGEVGINSLEWAAVNHEDSYARDISQKVLQEKRLEGFSN